MAAKLGNMHCLNCCGIVAGHEMYLVYRGRPSDCVSVQGIVRPEALTWYAQQPFSAMLQCLKVDILRDETCIGKNEIPASAHGTDFQLSSSIRNDVRLSPTAPGKASSLTWLYKSQWQVGCQS